MESNKQAVTKSTQNGNEQGMVQWATCLPTGPAAERVLQRVSSEWWKQTMYAGSFKNDCKESPELLLCEVFSLFYLPVTKLHDFFASLIKQLIDDGAL